MFFKWECIFCGLKNFMRKLLRLLLILRLIDFFWLRDFFLFRFRFFNDEGKRVLVLSSCICLL